MADKLQLLKNGLDFAKQNPDAPQSVELRKRIESGMYARELSQLKEQTSPAFSLKVQPKKEAGFLQKAGEVITGGKMGQNIGQAIFFGAGGGKAIADAEKSYQDYGTQLANQASREKDPEKKKALLRASTDVFNESTKIKGSIVGEIRTPEQIAGDALGLATNTISAGSLPGALGKATTANGVVKGAIQGAKTGVISGGIFGTSTGAAKGMQENKDLGGITKDAAIGGLVGAGTGAIIGGVVGGVSGGLKGRALRRAVLDNKIATGDVPPPGGSGGSTQFKQKAIQIAKQQGFDDTDIQFINSMKDTDKVKAQKMIDLAEKASVNKRALERPIDIVGDSMTDRVKFIQKQNSTFGKAVDTTAKELKGQMVDTTQLKEKTLSLLEDAGVTINNNGTPNWSKSIFNKTPELQNKIMKTLSDLPGGEIDAYDLHNFKKSIDEVVNYGVGGEGLKGKSASILKAVRSSADEILDSNFDAYNKANTDYKATRDVLDMANDLFGKKSGVGKERGGQLLRSVFSNNTQRPRVMALVEQLDKITKNYGGGFEDNLLDQTLFTEILEDVYGTQATTSLQGQVARAVKGTQKVIEGVRNPIKGAGELAATITEKSLGISDENKRKILKSLLR